METQCVFWKVATEFLNNICMKFRLQTLMPEGNCRAKEDSIDLLSSSSSPSPSGSARELEYSPTFVCLSLLHTLSYNRQVISGLLATATSSLLQIIFWNFNDILPP
jgi:hypothetical protein